MAAGPSEESWVWFDLKNQTSWTIRGNCVEEEGGNEGKRMWRETERQRTHTCTHMCTRAHTQSSEMVYMDSGLNLSSRYISAFI